MHCDDVRPILLDYGWGADERRRAILLLSHLESCDACRAAFADYDVLRDSLRRGGPAGPGAEEPAAEPPQGWDAFLRRLEPPAEGTPNATGRIGAEKAANASNATGPANAANTANLPNTRTNGYSSRLRLRPAIGRAATLAACVLLAVGAYQFGRTAGSSSPAVAEESSGTTGKSTTGKTGGDGKDRNAAARAEATLLASLTLSPADAAGQANAFEQVSDVYDRKASWLMTSAGGASDVGLVPEPVPAGRKLLMLRLTVLHAGAVASSADVVIVPGQSANLTLPMADGRSLKYQIGTSAGEPTELTLWLEVHNPRGRGEMLAAMATNLRVRPGERVTAGELATSAGRYELKVGFTQTRATPAAAAPAGQTGGRS